MAQATLTHILNEIQTLETEELKELERAVCGLLEPSTQEAERETVLQILQASGRVKDVKRPSMRGTVERHPVAIQGKSLSETIIEERR
jgi:hypothetical protein